ncbi:prenyl protease, putative, partial [Ixodes scapularis]
LVLCTANTVRPYWTVQNIFIFALAVSWIAYLWETYLSYRQYKLCKSTSRVPAEVSSITDQETFSKARLYQLDKSKFGFYAGLWNQVETTLVLILGGFPFFWSLCEQWAAKAGFSGNEVHHMTKLPKLEVHFGCSALTFLLAEFPSQIISKNHGTTQEVPNSRDSLLSAGRVNAPNRWSPPNLYTQQCKVPGDFHLRRYVEVTVEGFVVASRADGAFRVCSQALNRADDTLQGKHRVWRCALSMHLFTKVLFHFISGSKRSSHSNAYFYGLFKEKKIVLFDTLLEKTEPLDKENGTVTSEGLDEKVTNWIDLCPPTEKKETKKTGCDDNEVLGVLAHELGHWKLNHVLKNFVIGQVHLFFCFMIFAMLYKDTRLYEAFGFYGTRPVFVGLILIFMYIFSPYNTLLEFLMTALSRHFEFEADAFARKMHRASYLRSALIKLNRDNLSFPVHDWLYSAWHHSHPPVLERVKALGKTD